MGPGAHSRLRGEGARVRSWLRLTSRSMRRPRVSSGRRQRGEVSVEVRGEMSGELRHGRTGAERAGGGCKGTVLPGLVCVAAGRARTCS